jgi:hypothetical protein
LRNPVEGTWRAARALPCVGFACMLTAVLLSQPPIFAIPIQSHCLVLLLLLLLPLLLQCCSILATAQALGDPRYTLHTGPIIAPSRPHMPR